MTPEDLVEIEAIKQLKARYFRSMDEKRWDDWGQVFTEVHGRGHYHEEYEKGADGQWRIAKLVLTRLWIRREGPAPLGLQAADSGEG